MKYGKTKKCISNNPRTNKPICNPVFYKKIKIKFKQFKKKYRTNLKALRQRH